MSNRRAGPTKRRSNHGPVGVRGYGGASPLRLVTDQASGPRWAGEVAITFRPRLLQRFDLGIGFSDCCPIRSLFLTALTSQHFWYEPFRLNGKTRARPHARSHPPRARLPAGTLPGPPRSTVAAAKPPAQLSPCTPKTVRGYPTIPLTLHRLTASTSTAIRGSAATQWRPIYPALPWARTPPWRQRTARALRPQGALSPANAHQHCQRVS